MLLPTQIITTTIAKDVSVSHQRILAIALITLTYCTHLATAVNIISIMGQTISSTQFFLYGKRHFTQTGYQRHVKKYAEAVQTAACVPPDADGSDGMNMTGRVVVVTGANSGLGKEVATYCASKGAKLYMMCRSKERAEKARDEIVGLTGNNDVDIVLADVSELHSVRKAAEELQSKEKAIDTIICNAGVLLNDERRTSEGNEVTFASHLLGGSYLLPRLLLPQLKAAGDKSRVIFVTSGGMYNFKFPSWDVATRSGEGGGDKVKYDGAAAYSYAKRGQVLLAERWSEEFPEVAWVTVHPGWADTPAVEEAFGDAKKYLNPLRTPWQGAEGVAWLAAADRSRLESGALYLDRTTQPKHVAGPFFSEGSFTKNTPEEIDEMMKNLREAANI